MKQHLPASEHSARLQHLLRLHTGRALNQTAAFHSMRHMLLVAVCDLVELHSILSHSAVSRTTLSALRSPVSCLARRGGHCGNGRCVPGVGGKGVCASASQRGTCGSRRAAARKVQTEGAVAGFDYPPLPAGPRGGRRWGGRREPRLRRGPRAGGCCRRRPEHTHAR